jgi:hypothetical protein
MELVIFFGLGLIGFTTLYLNVRYSRSMTQAVCFSLVGIAFLAAQCLLVKFFADFGRAFGGDDSSGVVLITVAFCVIAAAGFVIAAINKFSNGRE